MQPTNEFEEALRRYLTDEQLTRIRGAKVGIAGVGGLGSNCAMALVRTGFRRLKIADFDLVEASNLNRQFYFLHQKGMSKVEALIDNLSQINPNLEIEASQMELGAENIASFFDDCDVIVEAFDRPDCKKLIVEAFMNSEKFLVAASGLAGWGNSDRVKTHRLKRNFYMIGDLSTGIGPGTPPLAPCVLIAAAKQADVVLEYVLGGIE